MGHAPPEDWREHLIVAREELRRLDDHVQRLNGPKRHDDDWPRWCWFAHVGRHSYLGGLATIVAIGFGIWIGVTPNPGHTGKPGMNEDGIWAHGIIEGLVFLGLFFGWILAALLTCVVALLVFLVRGAFARKPKPVADSHVDYLLAKVRVAEDEGRLEIGEFDELSEQIIAGDFPRKIGGEPVPIVPNTSRPETY